MTGRDWLTEGLGGTGLQRDWKGLAYRGTGRDWLTEGLEGTGLQRDWEGLAYRGTGLQRDWLTERLAFRGTSLHHCTSCNTETQAADPADHPGQS